MDNEEREDSVEKCYGCDAVCLCEWGPDPYSYEIYDDDTPVWECADCRYESYMGT